MFQRYCLLTIIMIILIATMISCKKQITQKELGMEFVYISPGTFMMGTPASGAGRQHQVTLTKGYYLQMTEVTQSQWQAVMGNNPSKFKGDNLPVECVSWNDVQEFIRKLNQMDPGKGYRLPTEAEWEYACRAGTTTAYYWGKSMDGSYCWYDGNSSGKTHEVGTKKPNAWGLFDMIGNIYEWCQDWYGDYPSGEVTNPQGPGSGSYRLLRGGSWSNDAGFCRSARRNGSPPGWPLSNAGFRLAAATRTE